MLPHALQSMCSLSWSCAPCERTLGAEQEAELEDEGEAARLAAWDANVAHEAFQAQRRAAEEHEAELQRRAEAALLVSPSDWTRFAGVQGTPEAKTPKAKPLKSLGPKDLQGYLWKRDLGGGGGGCGAGAALDGGEMLLESFGLLCSCWRSASGGCGMCHCSMQVREHSQECDIPVHSHR